MGFVLAFRLFLLFYRYFASPVSRIYPVFFFLKLKDPDKVECGVLARDQVVPGFILRAKQL